MLVDSSYTQIDLDTDMEEETGPVPSKTNKKRVLMKLKGSSSSVRRETVKYESSSGKDLARALTKLSPGGIERVRAISSCECCRISHAVCSPICSAALVAH